MEQQVECPNYVRAFVTQKVLKVNQDERTVTHLITSAAVDRAGDIVEPKGIDLSNYIANPVVLADHSYSIDRIIGKAIDIRVGDEGITATTQFRDTPLAREAFALSVEGIGGWSIGFRPRMRHYIRDGATAECKRCKDRMAQLDPKKNPSDDSATWGMHFKTSELLEYSSVAIPMNQDIVNNAVERGLCSRENVPAFFTVQAEAQEPSKDAGQGPTAETLAQKTVHPALVEIVRRNRKQLRNYAVERAIDDVLRKIHG